MHPDQNNTLLTVVDVQTKLCAAVPDLRTGRVSMLIQGVRALQMPVLVTEQYPAGLGPTIPEIMDCLPEGTVPVAKTSFSCCGEDAFLVQLKAANVKNVILCGIEAHVCVRLTALDLLDMGYHVWLAADAAASRHDYDCSAAIEGLRHAGVIVTTAEAILFELLGNAKNPAFKTISKLVR